MSHQTLEALWKNFSALINQPPATPNESINTLMKHYINQNIIILNEVLSSSIDHLHQLQQASSLNDIICMQARLASELSKKLSLSSQRFLESSLGHRQDYNEWLKAHCDLATD